MVSIVYKSSYRSGQYTGSSSVFLQINFQSRQKDRANTQRDRSITSSELSFHGLPSKSKRPSKETENRQYRRYYQLIVLFLRNSHLQRDIQQTFFRQFLCELFENFCSASKYVSKTLRKFNKKKQKQKKETKKTRPWRKVFAKFTGKRSCQRLYLNKVTGLRL